MLNPNKQHSVQGGILPAPGSEYRPPCSREGCNKPCERGRRLCSSCRKRDKTKQSQNPERAPSTRLTRRPTIIAAPAEPGPFTPERQAMYLEYICAGLTRMQAGKAAGAKLADVRNARRVDPVFAAAESDAEEVACEEVEGAMRELALRGHFQAQQFILANRSTKRWTMGQKSELKVTGQITHIDAAEAHSRIEQLMGELAKRASLRAGEAAALPSGQASEVIDAEIVSDTG